MSHCFAGNRYNFALDIAIPQESASKIPR